MNSKEAFEILGLNESATAEEIKKKYRSLAAKYHPDVCKDADANDKIKKINEAHSIAQSVKDGTYQDPNSFRGNPFARDPFGGFGFNIDDLINSFNKSKKKTPFNRSQTQEEPTVSLEISFEESVKGCPKEISFSRFTRCNDCHGQGYIEIKNDCTKCDGFGRKVQKSVNFMSSSSCSSCYGKGVTSKDCKNCSSTGSIDSKASFSVNIPPGILNDQTLRLQGAGHFYTTSFGDMIGDAFLHVKVKPHPKMKIKNKDVVSIINISLLEALEGKSLKEETVYGEVDVKIPEKSKNGDVVSFTNKGVGGKGAHKFKINIEYPSDISSLIDFLKDK